VYASGAFFEGKKTAVGAGFPVPPSFGRRAFCRELGPLFRRHAFLQVKQLLDMYKKAYDENILKQLDKIMTI
jgi:hypothetical protein